MFGAHAGSAALQMQIARKPSGETALKRWRGTRWARRVGVVLAPAPWISTKCSECGRVQDPSTAVCAGCQATFMGDTEWPPREAAREREQVLPARAHSKEHASAIAAGEALFSTWC